MVQAIKPSSLAPKQAAPVNPINFRTLEKIERQILNRTDLTPKELLHYQIVAQKFQLQIEFATRIAEGISSGIKRLQTQNQ